MNFEIGSKLYLMEPWSHYYKYDVIIRGEARFSVLPRRAPVTSYVVSVCVLMNEIRTGTMKFNMKYKFEGVRIE